VVVVLGPNTKVMRKAKMSFQSGQVKQVIRTYAVEVQTGDRKDLDVEAVTLKLRKAMGANCKCEVKYGVCGANDGTQMIGRDRVIRFLESNDENLCCIDVVIDQMVSGFAGFMFYGCLQDDSGMKMKSKQPKRSGHTTATTCAISKVNRG
jgi:hypothetical protein